MENFGRDGGDRQSKKGKGKDFEAEEEAYEETKLAGVRLSPSSFDVCPKAIAALVAVSVV